VLAGAAFTVAQQTAAIAIYGNTACTAPAQANLNVNSGACNPVSTAVGCHLPAHIASSVAASTLDPATQLVLPQASSLPTPVACRLETGTATS